jgi:hypothetical protein
MNEKTSEVKQKKKNSLGKQPCASSQPHTRSQTCTKQIQWQVKKDVKKGMVI